LLELPRDEEEVAVDFSNSVLLQGDAYVAMMCEKIQ
jgi:hypothetical protein